MSKFQTVSAGALMGFRVSRFFSAIAFTVLLAALAVSDEVKSAVLIYSPWIKFCVGETCFVGKDAHADCVPVVAAVLIERSGETKRTLRVTLPTGMNVEHGIRIIIDQDQPIDRPYVQCFPYGCRADYDAGPELVDRLKSGKMLLLEVVDSANSPISLSVPLVDFASAYDGPARAPKVFEAQSGQLQKELQARARKEPDTRSKDDRETGCESK